jgi:uncharacterized protein YceH (UPF0502 family)
MIVTAAIMYCKVNNDSSEVVARREKMTTKETYLREVEAQLKSWNNAIDGMVVKVGQAQTEGGSRFRQLIQDFSTIEAEALKHLESLRRADNLEWEQHKARLVQLMITLREQFEQLEEAAQRAEKEAIGWAQGLA